MKIEQDVLEVLSAVTVDGANARIEQQLDRAMYTRVNQVLEAIGGKWNRKQKAHVFPSDAATLLDAVITAGEVTTAQDTCFFPTPLPLAHELVATLRVRSGDRALEPSAGSGNFVRALLDAGVNSVDAFERDPQLRTLLASRMSNEIDDGRFYIHATDDFVTHALAGRFDVIAMNPPFRKVGAGDHIDHVRRAYEHLARPSGRLCAVLPAGVLFRQDRRHVAFRTWVSRVGGELRKLPSRSFHESGTDVETCALTISGL